MTICKHLSRVSLAVATVFLQLALAASDASARPRTWDSDHTVTRRQPTWMPFAVDDRRPNPAVAQITTIEGNTRSQGSGTLVDVRGQRGLVVTNWHVVRNATGPIVATFPDGFRSAATVLKVDQDWDLAALLIWRPNASPVPISTTAPRPGDPLTIAGYGAGNYRAISGKCTQYVAPGRDKPYEMVEVSVEARQGDSGGPILNEQGELAGVLFGAGGGSTSGSFCGRVRWFLASAWPADLPHNTDTLVAVPNRREASDETVSSWPKDAFAAVPHVAVPRYSTASPPTPNYNIGTGISSATVTQDKSGATKDGVSLKDLAGNSPIERAKAILAAVGILAVVIQAVRLGSSKS